ncbi:MFS transporter [Trichocoleus desertorum AS-A10]|uniref:MFS transporter n=1 Tax=Trichocoleus desertorum TaxID=1481672 RepID=UPI003296F135
MLRQAVDLTTVEVAAVPVSEILDPVADPEPITVSRKPSKQAIRTSLRASTLDGVFATIFSNVAGGVLLSNFLVELDASPVELGMLASIPLLANLLQPLGAYLANRTTSRHRYGLWIYAPARLLWLILVLGIGVASLQPTPPHLLVQWALAIVVLTHFLGALGGASWFSWVAALVPRQLRGRYFGIRNSAISLTNLLSVPLVGLAVTAWPGGSIQGYGVLLFLGVIVGLVSIGFQYWMVDVNPQAQQQEHAESLAQESADLDAVAAETSKSKSFWQDRNFLMFLLYFALWSFSVNLSAPFFNIYLLDTLSLDVNWVTTYTSLGAGANLLMLVLWGRLADRIGNRPILVLVGILVAVTPLLWLGTGTDLTSLLVWFPLLHILAGGTWAAIDLCINNIQLGVAPVQHQATYFAIAGAVAGVSGALGTTAGGFLIEFTNSGGILGLFALSSVIRLAAILPLLFVREQRPRSVRQAVQALAQGLSNALRIPRRSPLLLKPQAVAVEATTFPDQAQ